MILDSSVIVAIPLWEPGYEELVGKMLSANTGPDFSRTDIQVA